MDSKGIPPGPGQGEYPFLSIQFIISSGIIFSLVCKMREIMFQLTQCEPCPVGYECSSASDPPNACLAGSYSTAISTSCTTCPGGHYCPDPTEPPIACSDGYYAAQVSICGLKLKRLNQAKIMKKSVILFWLPNMTV